MWSRYLALGIALASCGTSPRVGTIADEGVQFAQPPEGDTNVTWDFDGDFYLDGVLMGTITCLNQTDPAIAGDDDAFEAYVAANCTAVVAPDGPAPSDPCAVDAGYQLSADGTSYTLSTCVPTAVSEGDPYWGNGAQWVEVPDWAEDYDAECFIGSDGTGACNFYRDIDPIELSSYDGFYPEALAIEPGAAPPGNPNPIPPPPPRSNPVMDRIGAFLIAIGGLTAPANAPLAKAIVDIGSTIVKTVDEAREQHRKIQQQKPQQGNNGAPPTPPSPWRRGLFKRGGTQPTDPLPTIPPKIPPPMNRPIPTPPGGTIPVRPPFRPPGSAQAGGDGSGSGGSGSGSGSAQAGGDGSGSSGSGSAQAGGDGSGSSGSGSGSA